LAESFQLFFELHEIIGPFRLGPLGLVSVRRAWAAMLANLTHTKMHTTPINISHSIPPPPGQIGETYVESASPTVIAMKRAQEELERAKDGFFQEDGADGAGPLGRSALDEAGDLDRIAVTDPNNGARSSPSPSESESDLGIEITPDMTPAASDLDGSDTVTPNAVANLPVDSGAEASSLNLTPTPSPDASGSVTETGAASSSGTEPGSKAIKEASASSSSSPSRRRSSAGGSKSGSKSPISPPKKNSFCGKTIVQKKKKKEMAYADRVRLACGRVQR
jgi:hypothetical protein